VLPYGGRRRPTGVTEPSYGNDARRSLGGRSEHRALGQSAGSGRRREIVSLPTIRPVEVL